MGAATEQGSAASGVPTEVTAPMVDHSWETVQLTEAFSDPVVVTGPISYRGVHPATPRLRNVTASAFDVSVEEWMYLDDWHHAETIGLLVTDRGRHNLSDGTPIEVGQSRLDHQWSQIAFESEFPTTPIVISQAQTTNGWQPVTTRHRNVSGTGMEIRLQEEEAAGYHLDETVGYVAVPPGTGTFDEYAYEAGVASDVTHEWQTITFDQSYDQPVILGDVQTSNGWNTCGLRYRNLTGSSVEVKVEEEQSGDAETAHVGERVGYVVLEQTSGPVGYGSGGYGSGGYGR